MHEQRPECVVYGVRRVTITLCVAAYVINIAKIAVALTSRSCRIAELVRERSQETGSAKLLTVAAIVGADYVGAELPLVPPPRRRKRVVELVLAVLQLRRLGSPGHETADPLNWNRELRTEDQRVEFGNRRSQLELHPRVVDKRST